MFSKIGHFNDQRNEKCVHALIISIHYVSDKRYRFHAVDMRSVVERSVSG